MLRLEDQGMLIVAALNDHLPNPVEFEAGTDTDRCCPACCAVCDLLLRLADTGHLDAVIKQAPDYLWDPSWDWWKDGGVNKDVLRKMWGCTAWPPCNEDL